MTRNLPDSEDSSPHATALYEAMLGWLTPLAVDLVISGGGRGEIGFLALRERLTDWNAAERGASCRIGVALFLAEPPQLNEGEVTAKGDLNGRKIMERRADILDALYEGRAGVVRL